MVMPAANTGEKIFSVSGTIESTGVYTLKSGGKKISSVIFTDGTKLKNVVVEADITGYVNPGIEGVFTLYRHGNMNVLLAFENTAGAVRVADTAGYSRGARSLMILSTLFFTVPALFFVMGAGVNFGPIAFFICLAATVVLWLVTNIPAFGVFAIVKAIKDIEIGLKMTAAQKRLETQGQAQAA